MTGDMHRSQAAYCLQGFKKWSPSHLPIIPSRHILVSISRLKTQGPIWTDQSSAHLTANLQEAWVARSVCMIKKPRRTQRDQTIWAITRIGNAYILYASICFYMIISDYICIFIYIYMHIPIHIHIYIYIYNTYTYTYTHTWRHRVR